ncbi:CRISPR-associated protein Cas4 [Halorubrum laminariae]|uniref:CRISPR-associated exonuclease Cas4 n=1 Tax=Halorubrum laminariae TaxID=1433523 RepID=A0ABD6BXZ8_9EURY|nr:hypothetical protein [Halorubrum laminariae]
MIPFSDVARAAYCPRQLYYARREDDRQVPPEARARIDLAFRYPSLVDASDATLRRLPIRRSPAAYRRNLSRLHERDDYDRLVAPDRTRAFCAGKDCHGTVHKVLTTGADGDATDDESGDAETDDASDNPPPTPVIVSPGEPPENGVWEPQTVRAVAAAKALSWERKRTVPSALVEYPTVGVVRSVRLTRRTRAAYRRALRAARAIDGPPPRIDDDRCSGCDYREQCGVGRRSLRSLLG